MRGALSKKEVGEHNQLIKLCQQARWEFMVHRQAVGFTIQNYQLVTSLYVIPPMLEEWSAIRYCKMDDRLDK